MVNELVNGGGGDSKANHAIRHAPVHAKSSLSSECSSSTLTQSYTTSSVSHPRPMANQVLRTLPPLSPPPPPLPGAAPQDITSLLQTFNDDSKAADVDHGASVPSASAAEDKDDDDKFRTKWEPVIGPRLTVVVARLTKPDAESGLGISLEGTVDVEDGREVRPHHYIRSVLPGGPVGDNGVLRSGDELLEVEF